MRKGQSLDCPFPGGEWVREPTAASGGGRKADEGKTTSRQEGIYAVAVCADCFSGPRIASRVHLGVGEGADRRQWRMQGSGRRENNEQTRGYLYRRSMR